MPLIHGSMGLELLQLVQKGVIWTATLVVDQAECRQAGTPERNCAIRCNLDPIKPHDDVVWPEMLGSLVSWLDVAHQDALLLFLHAIG